MNQNPNNQNEKEALRWQFWFLVSFSLLLVVTFIYWLPLRFFHQAGEDMEMQMMDEIGEHPEEAHGLSQYHEEGEVREGLSVAFNVTPSPLDVGDLARLDFFVREKPDNIPVPVEQLEVAHTKKMHVIGVRSDLNEFLHIHPDPTEVRGVMSVLYEFKKPGLYKIWSEARRDGVDHITGHPEFEVVGEGPTRESIGTFAKNRIVDNYQMRLDYDEATPAGREVDISFDAHDLTGGEVELEDYLGEKIHLTIIKDDLKTFLHLHPETGGHQAQNGFRVISEALANGAPHVSPEEDEAINFHVVFPASGTYKLFAQFRPEGAGLLPDEALTADFLVKVVGRSPLVSDWWLYLIISLVLIVLLSWGVNKYLQVKQ